jgi:hypothetical protein
MSQSVGNVRTVLGQSKFKIRTILVILCAGLLAVLMATTGNAAPSPEWQARHRLTAAEYQQTFDQLRGQGFRLVQVSGYGVAGQDRYAAIWERREGPELQARHGLTAAQYQQTFDQLRGQGFRLVQVSGYSIGGGQDRYAAIWEKI